MASIAINFLLGRTLAERTGVTDEASKNVVAVVTMGLGLTPVGVLLARQVALQRAAPPPAVQSAATNPSGASSAGGTSGTPSG